MPRPTARSRRRSANLIGSLKQREALEKAIAIGLAPSTGSSADARRGIGRKIMPTCWKVCARPAGTSERAVSAATVRDQKNLIIGEVELHGVREVIGH
jgi:hypothetical protein